MREYNPISRTYAPAITRTEFMAKKESQRAEKWKGKAEVDGGEEGGGEEGGKKGSKNASPLSSPKATPKNTNRKSLRIETNGQLPAIAATQESSDGSVSSANSFKYTKIPMTLAEKMYCEKVDIDWEKIMEKAKKNQLPFHVPQNLISRPVAEIEFHYSQLQKDRILRNKLDEVEEASIQFNRKAKNKFLDSMDFSNLSFFSDTKSQSQMSQSPSRGGVGEGKVTIAAFDGTLGAVPSTEMNEDLHYLEEVAVKQAQERVMNDPEVSNFASLSLSINPTQEHSNFSPHLPRSDLAPPLHTHQSQSPISCSTYAARRALFLAFPHAWTRACTFCSSRFFFALFVIVILYFVILFFM